MAIFKENLTSKVLQETAIKVISKSKKKLNILEVGCGNGNITNYIIKHKKKNHFFHLSDISKNAIDECKEKIKYKLCIFKTGKWLKPWNAKKFDIIICDISAISDYIAKESDWYKGVTCNAGSDGLKNIKIILKNLKNNLKKNGRFILPIISLSNEKKLKNELNKTFESISYSKKINWPLPAFFEKNILKYKNLEKKGHINYINKFGVKIAYTYSATCKNFSE